MKWYLNLSFWQAVLVWLKLLLPILWALCVFWLVVMSYRLFKSNQNPIIPALKLGNKLNNQLGKTIQSKRNPTTQKSEA